MEVYDDDAESGGRLAGGRGRRRRTRSRDEGTMREPLIAAMENAVREVMAWPEIHFFHHNDADGLGSGALLDPARRLHACIADIGAGHADAACRRLR